MGENFDKKNELLEKIQAFRVHLEELRKLTKESTNVQRHDGFLNSLLESIPDSIYFKDTRLRYLLINNAHARFLGIGAPRDAHGRTDFEFLDANCAREAHTDEQFILQTGKPILNKREKIILRGGTCRWMSTTKVPLRDSEGKIFGVVGISRDITDEKREEEKRGESERRVRRLLADSSDVISILDRKGTVLYESPSANRIFGVDERRPRIGTNFFAYCHPEDLKDVIYTFSDLVQRPRESRKLTFRFRHSDGTWILLESICRNLLDDPAINGVIVSSRDITDRKRAEDRIKIFEHVVKSANDSIVIADLQNYIIFVNQSFCETYGYSSEEVIGEHIRIIWSQKNADIQAHEIFPESPRTGWEGELCSRRKDGTDFPVYVSTSIIRDDSGNPIAIAGIIRDITKQKQLEEQLRQSQKMESLSVLVGGIAHNFNNILGVIMGYASLLEDPNLDREKLRNNVGVITEAAERGAHLVQQLMTYIKKSPIRFEDVAVNEVIGEMADMVMQTFPKTITFSVNLDGRNPIVHGDQNQLRQVLFNLLLNARDAMPNGGTISIRTDVLHGRDMMDRIVKARDIEYVKISVTDTGVGMDEELQNRIFDPFFTTKEIGKGVGLGLPMVYGIADTHGGFVDVESRIDEGSTFCVFFPLLRFGEQIKKPTTTQDDPDYRGYGTVLVVEDEDSMRIVIADTLKEHGYTVFLAQDGIEALQVFEREHQRLDTVLLDIGLPRLGGYETFLKMREHDASIPVIVASGYNDPDARCAIETAGADHFIQKPYKFNQILKVIKDVVDMKRGRR